MWGKVPSLAKVAAQRLPLRLLALFSSSAPEMVLAFLGVYSCFVGAGYPPPLQTIFFFLLHFFSPPIMVGLEFWIFSLCGIFVAGGVMQGSWGTFPFCR